MGFVPLPQAWFTCLRRASLSDAELSNKLNLAVMHPLSRINLKNKRERVNCSSEQTIFEGHHCGTSAQGSFCARVSVHESIMQASIV